MGIISFPLGCDFILCLDIRGNHGFQENFDADNNLENNLIKKLILDNGILIKKKNVFQNKLRLATRVLLYQTSTVCICDFNTCQRCCVFTGP